MAILNVHERVLLGSITKAGELIDHLTSPDDVLWPHDRWPAMRFDRPLEVGEVGGHGPIRYVIEEYRPGQFIRFRFSAPIGFLGTHRFEVQDVAPGRVRLRHVLEMRVVSWARFTWPLVYRPLHDALLEDALDRAESFVGGRPPPRAWSVRVRLLRWILRRIQTRTRRTKATPASLLVDLDEDRK